MHLLPPRRRQERHSTETQTQMTTTREGLYPISLSLDSGDIIPKSLASDAALTWLPPRAASAHEILQWVWCAVAGAWTWEILTNLSEEYTLLAKFKFTYPQLLYVLSRLTTTACVYLSLAFLLAEVEDCDALFRIAATLLSVAPLLSSALMFIRLRAVYLHNSRAIYTLFVLWIVCSAVTFGTTVPAVRASHIGTTHRCIMDSVNAMAGVGIILNVVTDSVFFLALSYKMLKMYQFGDTWHARLRVFLGGSEGRINGIRRRGLSHALLRSGQQYYLVTVIVCTLTAILPFLTHLPLDIRLMPGMPYIALQNVMMCKVYRQLKLGLIVNYDFDVMRLSVDTNTGSLPKIAPTHPPAADAFVAMSNITQDATTQVMIPGCTLSHNLQHPRNDV